MKRIRSYRPSLESLFLLSLAGLTISVSMLLGLWVGVVLVQAYLPLYFLARISSGEKSTAMIVMGRSDPIDHEALTRVLWSHGRASGCES